MSEVPKNRVGQIFSMWAAGTDDPLRLTVDAGKLFARIEAQQAFGTKGTPIEAGVWYHLAAVKAGGTLALYFDGRSLESITVPQSIVTSARSCAIGGNPNYGGNECLAGEFADFALYARALRPEQVAGMAKQPAR